jgi:hypothetical protein
MTSIATPTNPAASPKSVVRLIPWLVAAALLLPLVFGSPKAPGALHLGAPRVFNGGEPHYLLLINSLLLDGDFNLANNYAAARAGAGQAGLMFAGTPLDHQTAWYDDGQRREWQNIYQLSQQDWRRDAAGRLTPPLRPGQTAPAPGHPEYPTQFAGAALILAPLLFPFRHSAYVEPLAIACSCLSIIAAMLLFRAWARQYSNSRLTVDLVTAVTFLGTPAWFYGRALFDESFLLLFAVGAYSLALRGKSPLLAGVFIGLGMLMKPLFALLGVPLGLMYLAARNFRAVELLALPAVFALTAYLGLNVAMFGAPLRTSLPWEQGSFIDGVTGVLFSLRYGYLITTPAIIAALAAWPAFFRAHRRDAIVLAAGIALYFALSASYGSWSGSTSYAARYEVPLLPLLFIALVKLPEMRLWRARPLRYATIAICALSIAGNGLAAIPYWRMWDSNAALFVLEGKLLPRFLKHDMHVGL